MKKIYMNGNFYTFDKLKPLVQSVVIEDGRFIDMGSTVDMVRQWGRPSTEIINLEGKTATPGLIDSHLHLAGIAQSFLNLDVTGITSKADMLEKIKEKAATLKKDEWLLGRGWDENLFMGDTIPTIQELDSVAPHCPLYIPRICGHASLVNTKALEASNYHPNITVPEGGTVVLDDRTKEPTGLLLEGASDLITKHIPEHTYSELKDAMRKAIHFSMKKGLTSVHTNDPNFLGGLQQTYDIYDALLNEEQLGLRCNLLIDHTYMGELKEKRMYTGYGNETLQIGAIKIFADGALGRRTALLSEPYADDASTYGDAMYDDETLYNIVRGARELSMPIAVHAIGDQALEKVLNTLDQFPTVAYRDRLIHVQVLREELIQRLAVPSRIADIQPRFLAGDFPWVADRLGPERTKLSYAWKSLIEANVVCAGGSDCPVEPVDPLLGIHAAVTRRKPGESSPVYNEAEKLSMYESFNLFTKMGAYPTNEETIKGTITRGKLADMTVYSENPFQMEDKNELLEMDIDMTIISGKITYRRE